MTKVQRKRRRSCVAPRSPPNSYPAVIIDRQEVVLPFAQLSWELALDPRQPPAPVDLIHRKRPLPRNQAPIESPCVTRKHVAPECRRTWQTDYPDQIPDTQFPPVLRHGFCCLYSGAPSLASADDMTIVPGTGTRSHRTY